MALSKTQVSQLYVSVFGRASEGEGNTYWQTDAASTDMVTTANVMLNTDAAKTYFGDTLNDNQKFIEHVYENTLGKTYAEDKDGVDYWVAELAGGKSKGEVIAALIEAAQAEANAGNAQDQFNNKVAVSDYTADTISAFTTTEAFTAFITGVTHESSTVDSAKTAVDAAKPSVPGESLALTTGADLVTGTANDDAITGYVGTNPISGNLENTAQSIDIIDGGAGDDTFSFSLTGTGAFGGRVEAVETVNATFYGAATYNMANTTGAATLNNINSIADLALTNVGSILELGVKSVAGNETNITYVAAADDGAEDVQKINLNDVSNNHDIDLNDSVIETIAIDSSTAASEVDLEDATAGTTKLTITGDADLDLEFQDVGADDADSTILKTIDASTFTGNLTLDADTEFGTLDQTITTGSGDDSVTIGSVTKDDVVNMGDGADKLTLVMGTTDLTTSAAFTNVETIVVTSTGNVTVDLEKSTELTNLVLTAASTATVTARDLLATANTVTFAGAKTTATEAFQGIDYKLKSTSGTSDALTVNVAAKSGYSKAEGVGVTVETFTANGIENITLNTSGLGADDTDTTGLQGGVQFKAFNATALQSLTVVSDSYVDLDATALASTVNTVDASGVSGGIDLDVSAVADTATTTAADRAVAITTGSGNDTLAGIDAVAATTVKSGDGKDVLTATFATDAQKALTIETEGGNDKLTVTGGDDAEKAVKVDMGDGDDTYITSGGAFNFTEASTIDFGAGTDDTLQINTTNGTIADFSNATLSNLEKITLLDGDYYIGFESLDEATIEITNVGTGDTGTIVGTDSSDSIDMTITSGQFSSTALKGIDFVGTHNLTKVMGGAGDDAITLGSATETVMFSASSNGLDTISDFAAGTDLLDGANTYGGAAIQIDAGTVTIAADEGAVAYADNITIAGTSATMTELRAVFTADTGDVATNVGAGEKFLFAVDDGAHTYILEVVDGGDGDLAADGTAADTITTLAKLSGVTDATGLTAASWVDFVAT